VTARARIAQVEAAVERLPARARSIETAWPRGLRRPEAAAYLGISPSKFDDWVHRGLMPAPKRQDGIVVWDRVRLDAAFEALPDDGQKGGDSEWKFSL
jgi:hypothetical protein